MQGKRYEIEMCEGALFPKLMTFSLPLALSGILQLLFNAADIMVIGRYVGREALAAVGTNTALVNMLVNLFSSLSVGSNILVARRIGAKQTDSVGEVVHSTIALSLLSGIFLMILGAAMAHQILVWMSSPDTIIGLSTLYLRLYFLGMPGLMVYNFGSALLRANGDTKRPLRYLTFAGVVNVCLNLFFVVVCKIGVAGVGLATAISQYISAALVLCCLMREEGILHLEWKKVCMKRKVVLQILKLGFPVGLQSVIFGLSNLIIQSSINTFGDVVMAGSAAASSIEGFIYITMNAVGQTALTFTGQNNGAKQYKRINRILLYCLMLSAVLGAGMGQLAYLQGRRLLGFYVSGQEEVIVQGMVRLRFYCRFHFLAGLMEVAAGVLRGMGYSLTPTMVSFMGSCGIRVLWVLLIFPLYRLPQTLYISYPISWAATTLVHLSIFFMIRMRREVYAVRI